MSAITLRNATAYVAQYVILKGERIVARLPGVAPGGVMLVPVDDAFQIIATSVIDGNSYTSAPMEVSAAMDFLAQVVQVPAQGTYEFRVVQTPASSPDQLQFQKTCLGPVTFTFLKNGVLLQRVVVSNSFEMVSLTIGGTFSIYAVINGITTATLTTVNPNVGVTAVQDTSDLEFGYFTLVLSTESPTVGAKAVQDNSDLESGYFTLNVT